MATEAKEKQSKLEHFCGIIQRHGRDIPDRPALIQDDEVRTWKEVSERASQIANRLRELGCGSGTKVALLGRNSIAFAEVMAGVLTAGASMVPLSTMATADILTGMLNDCKARVIFVDESYCELVEAILANVETIHPNGVVGLNFDNEEIPGLETWCEGRSTIAPDIEIMPGDLFGVLYSSGTTGDPKGIMLSHKTRLAQATTMAMAAFNTNAVNIISTPLYTYGAISTWMPTIVGGGANVLVSKFEAREYLQLIEKHKVTHAILVPVQYNRIMRVPEFDDIDISSMLYWFGGSAPMSIGLKREIAQRLPGEIIEFYSLTEGGITTALLLKHFPEKLGSVGTAANGCVIKVIDVNDHEVKAGEAGELVGRGTLRMSGYLNKKELTGSAMWTDKDGFEYFRTGDNGRIDEDGFVYLLDRKKDMIISGGFNIYASDIEAVIHEHDAVHEAAVVAAKSTRWGETPYAFVVLESGAEAAADDLKNWTNKQVGKAQRLAHVEIVKALPVNHLGKIQKNKLRDRLASAECLFD